MSLTLPILSSIIWTPILSGALLLAIPNKLVWQNRARFLPLVFSILTLCILTFAFTRFAAGTGAMQLTERLEWMPTLNIHYALGVDGFSILLTALTVFMTALVLIAGLTHIANKDYLKYSALFLIMQGLMCGVFLALDAILFYVFFEAMMIPMFLLIGIWGAENRIYATLKFMLYTLFGSLFLLTVIIYLGRVADSFSIADLQALTLDLGEQKWIFWGMLIAFAIKVPMWPVHTWLPDAHVEAPTGGSIILAAITLKIGGYGMLRLLLPIVPQASMYFANIVIILSLVAITYIGFVTLVQQDLKKLIAYSSIAHMGFVTLGLFVACKVIGMSEGSEAAIAGIDGAMLQMLAHGFISGALFLCVGIIYVRMHTRAIGDLGGIVNTMPLYATFLMLFALANVGMPGTIGFVGELLVIIASYKVGVWCAFLAATSLVLGAAYTLYMYKRVIFGEVTQQAVALLRDLSINEMLVCTLLALTIILFGVWPNPLLNILRGSSQQLSTQLLK